MTLIVVLSVVFGVFFAEGVEYWYTHYYFPFNLLRGFHAKCWVLGCGFDVRSNNRAIVDVTMRAHIQHHVKTDLKRS